MKTGRLVAVCFGSIMFYGMVLAVLGPLLPAISKTFHLNLSQTGMIFSATSLGFITFTIFSGFLADKYGKKKFLEVNLFGSFLSLFLLGISSGFGVMLVCMFFIGGCSGCLEGLASAILVDVNPSKESYYVNASQIFFGIGSVVAPILVGLALANGLLWKWCYTALSALFLLCFVTLLFTKVEQTHPSETVQFRYIWTILSNRKIQLLCVCMFCYSGAETCSWGWLSTFLEKDIGCSTVLASLSVSVLWAAAVIGRVGCLGALSKCDERKIIISLALGTIVGMLILATAGSPALIWVSIAVIGFGYSAQWPLILAHGLKDWPGYSGTVASIMITGTALGMTILPLLAGYLGDAYGMRATMAFPAIFLVVVAGIFFYLVKKYDGKMPAVS